MLVCVLLCLLHTFPGHFQDQSEQWVVGVDVKPAFFSDVDLQAVPV